MTGTQTFLAKKSRVHRFENKQYSERVAHCRFILESEGDLNVALDKVCKFIMTYERWRVGVESNFSIVEILYLTNLWSLLHVDEV